MLWLIEFCCSLPVRVQDLGTSNLLPEPFLDLLVAADLRLRIPSWGASVYAICPFHVN